jgi:hypothetical protein
METLIIAEIIHVGMGIAHSKKRVVIVRNVSVANAEELRGSFSRTRKDANAKKVT